MKKLFKKITYLTFIFLILGLSASFAYTPMDSYNSVVAGVGRGFRDGDFDQALFNNPTCLAFDSEGTRLFVADRDNNRIRVIYLNQNNRVETVAGTGQSGKQDGSASHATFDKPLDLTYVPDSQLIVFDQGTHLFRQIDLKTNVVTNLPAVTGEIASIVYHLQDNSVYFTNPKDGELDKLDLKTKSLSAVFKNNPLVPNPKALSIFAGKIYVADSNLTDIYQVGGPGEPALNWTQHLDHKILALTEFDSCLCALQEGQYPIVGVLPAPGGYAFATAWGFFVQSDYTQAKPLVPIDSSQLYGFTASAAQPRKFYICGGSSSVISIKGYDYSKHWYGVYPNDFDYPAAKPPKTFRILVMGDSRVVTSPRVDDTDLQKSIPSLMTDTYAKQLEFLLNMEAAENNVDTHYEVLILSHLGENPFFFGNFELPAFIKKYDIDLLMPNSTWDYRSYFLSPLSPEGIPLRGYDPEYALKPMAERIPSSGPARHFYELCQKRKLPVDTYVATALYYPELREAALEMYALPMRLLNEKVNAIKLKNGSTPKLVMSYIPWESDSTGTEDAENFYKELCQKTDIHLVSVVKGFNVFQTAFWPTQQQCCAHHYTAYGNQLIAYLLSEALIEQKLVPFEPIKNQKK
jgi:hypothetical protein